MSTLGFVNVSIWDVDQVYSWMNGLEDGCSNFASIFHEASINGKLLLSLENQTLEKLGIWQLGCQELILQSIRQLEAINVELERDTLSVIALRLDCQVNNLYNLLRNQHWRRSTSTLDALSHTVLINILSEVSDIVETVKFMVPWFDRIPFDDSEFFSDLKHKFLDCTVDLLSHSKAENLNDIQDICMSISSLCDGIIRDCKDPLVIQTSSFDLVTLRRDSGEALGMSIMSSYDNINTISYIKSGSAVDLCKKIHVGDEIIQVNYRTVIGWQLSKLMSMFKDNKKDVTLTLKKKPRHLTVSGYQKKRAPKKQLPRPGLQTEFVRKKSANAKAHSKQRIQDLMAATDGSIPEHEADDNVSDSEVFNNSAELSELNNNSDDKLRRATVSGASPPILKRCVVGSVENILSLRPKSYIPVSTNIPILPKEIGIQNLEFNNLLWSQQKEFESRSVIHSGASPPPSLKSSCGSVGESVLSTDGRSPIVSSTSPPPLLKSSFGSVGESVFSTEGRSPLVSSTSPPPSLKSSFGSVGESIAPTEVRSPVLVSPPSRKSSSGSANEVAGRLEEETGPRLLRLVKIDSTKRTEMSEQKRNESISSLDSILSNSSYSSQGSATSNLRQQKVHFRSERDLASPSPSGLLRRNFLRRTGLNRRISCKDLGRGDCQGWLWKKKEKNEGSGLRVSGRWSKCWFVLKNKALYYYKDPEDLKALGVIHLPGFTISPSQESRSKKFAFKAYNKTGTVFFFAAERQDDMAKWMNKIGLASLENLDTSHLTTTAGFRRPGKEDYHLPDFSESEEELGMSFKADSASISGSVGSREDLIGLYRNLRAADLDLAGTNIKARRSTILRASTFGKDSGQKNEKLCQLLALRRQLKDKEQVLSVLNELLQCSHPISGSDLLHFKAMHQSVFEEIEGQVNESEPSETAAAAAVESSDDSNFGDSHSFT